MNTPTNEASIKARVIGRGGGRSVMGQSNWERKKKGENEDIEEEGNGHSFVY